MDIQLKKSSIINKIKEFFDDKPDAEELSDMVLCNEASIFEPYAKKVTLFYTFKNRNLKSNMSK